MTEPKKNGRPKTVDTTNPHTFCFRVSGKVADRFKRLCKIHKRSQREQFEKMVDKEMNGGTSDVS